MADVSLPPGLYLVATPIGNLGDLSPRAADMLRQCDLILAEDKRVTAKLLAHIGARTPMKTYNDFSQETDRRSIIDQLGDRAIALVCDAGTPLISDPGYKLVRAARQEGRFVTTTPGPCAAIAALTLSGLPTDRFLFLGFLPSKANARHKAIEEIAPVHATLVLYESGQRLGESLGALLVSLGDRDAAVVREISKLHEECVTGTLGDLARRYLDGAPAKGEIVIVVAPSRELETVDEDVIDKMLDKALERLSPSRAAAEVAEQLKIPRKRVYDRAVERSRK